MAKQTLPSKLSGYETVFLTRAEMPDEGLKALNDRLKSVVAEYQGELVLEEDWGSKKLSYKIEKESRARYTYMAYTGKGNIVAEIERNLRLHDHVLRFLSVNLAKEFDKDAFFKRKELVKAQAKKREEEREARREEKAERRKSVIVDSDDDFGFDDSGE